MSRMERFAWGAGATGLLGLVIGWIIFPAQFAFAWVAALTCGIGLSLGSMALLLVHALTGGRWGRAIRVQLLTGALLMPLMLLLAIPLFFVLDILFPWVRTTAPPRNAFYLNLPFFLGRNAAYAIAWLALAGAVVLIGRRAETGRALFRLAPPGLIVLALTATFAAIDWTLSLDPTFKSSVYGMVICTEAVLFALSIAVVGACATTLPPVSKTAEDLGKLMLGLVVLWGYLDFMQILIIWQSDLPHEAHWYNERIDDAWLPLAAAIAALHFFIPFFLLLWPQVQRSRRMLRVIASVIIAGTVLHAWWLVIPYAGRGLRLLDPLALLAVAGLGAGLALRAPRLVTAPEMVAHHV